MKQSKPLVLHESIDHHSPIARGTQKLLDTIIDVFSLILFKFFFFFYKIITLTISIITDTRICEMEMKSVYTSERFAQFLRGVNLWFVSRFVITLAYYLFSSALFYF